MHGLSQFLQLALCLVLICVCTLSVQLAALAWVRVFRKQPNLGRAELDDAELPHVLVQLPVCNEGHLAVRVAAAAAAMDWPRDRLTIQLLDDGDGEGHDELAIAVRAVVPEGVNFHILSRGSRKGFKAGNLAFGLSHSDAPFVAVLDADFVPPAYFLHRTVPVLLADSGLAFVQSRWGHANREVNWLTRVQGLLLDSHFAVEQEARWRAGRHRRLRRRARGLGVAGRGFSPAQPTRQRRDRPPWPWSGAVGGGAQRRGDRRAGEEPDAPSAPPRCHS